MRRTIIISMAMGAVACNRDSGVPDDWEPPEKDTRQAGDSTPDTTAHAQDTSGSRCTRLSLSGVGLVFLDGSSSDTNAAFGDDLYDDVGFGDAREDWLRIDFYEDDDYALSETGEYDLGSVDNANWATCRQCVVGLVDYDDAGEAASYFLLQDGGTLIVDAATPPGSHTLRVTLLGVSLRAVTIDGDTAVSTVVPGGPCYTLDTVTLMTEGL